jgi:hypothetical protein
MQISDGGMAMNMNAQHHMEHFDNVLNLNMNNDYHYGVEYWNGSYKNGSTPMKEMEGEVKKLKTGDNCMFVRKIQVNTKHKESQASSHLSTHSLTPCNRGLCNS